MIQNAGGSILISFFFFSVAFSFYFRCTVTSLLCSHALGCLFFLRTLVVVFFPLIVILRDRSDFYVRLHRPSAPICICSPGLHVFFSDRFRPRYPRDGHSSVSILPDRCWLSCILLCIPELELHLEHC